MPNPNDFVELNRQFIEIGKEDIESSDIEARASWGLVATQSWPDVLAQYRVVLLSSAGAGKTWEIYSQCRKLCADGKRAYLIRLEALASEWDNVIFEDFGDIDSFDQAVAAREEMWLFLDSIDEARLREPRDFGTALKRLEQRIRDNLQNTHIILTSRAGAWRPDDDAALFSARFPYAPPKKNSSADQEDEDLDIEGDEEFFEAEASEENGTRSPIRYFTLRRLDTGQMRLFADARKVPDAELLVSEIVRLDLNGLAGRPKDLEDIIDFWRSERRLGKRKEIIEKSVERKLVEYDLDRAAKDPLTLEQARSGAKKLAASVALTHETKIIVPDRTAPGVGFEIQPVLDGWTAAECSALLGRRIFEPETYGFVRFDHRDSKEYLAACWFHDLIRTGQSRMRVENLFFKNQYGCDVVVPSLRPVLPWLAIFDQSTRTRVLNHWPEILLEGGDPASLPAADREQLLVKFCARYAADGGTRLSVDPGALQRLVSPDLSPVIRRLYDTYPDHDKIRQLLLQSIEIGLLNELADIAIAAAQTPVQSDYTRLASMRAVAAVCNDAQIASVCQCVSKHEALRSRQALGHFIEVFGPEYLSAETVMPLLAAVEPKQRYSVDGLTRAMLSYVKTCSTEAVEHVVCEAAGMIKQAPFIEQRFFEASEKNAWMLEFAIPACERLVEEKNAAALSEQALSIMSLTTLSRDYDIHDAKTNLGERVPQWRELNAALFWHDVEDLRKLRDEKKGERLTEWWQARNFRDHWRFDNNHIEEAIGWIESKTFIDDKLVALSLAFEIYRNAGRPAGVRRRLWKAVEGNEDLRIALKNLLNPPAMSEEEKRRRRSDARWKKEQRVREQKKSEYHAAWRAEIPKCLDHIAEKVVPPSGRMWRSQTYLFERMRELGKEQNRWAQTNWRDLIEEVGREAAEAMRDGLMAIWRRYNPTLVSEAGERTNSVPVIETMGLSGLEIEHREKEDWLSRLTKEDAERAARYLLSELNGFPSWFEEFDKCYPEITLSVLSKEIEWDLFDNNGDGAFNYVLSEIVWRVPWFGRRFAPHLLALLQDREPGRASALSQALTLLLQCEAIAGERIAILCAHKIAYTETPAAHRHLWFAAWVSVDPEPAISGLAEALASLDKDEAVQMAMAFINALYGSRYEGGMSTRANHETANHLKRLYFLMSRYIRQEDDIDRTGERRYSPTDRDHAQEARGRIYNKLCDIPGKEAFDALVAIASAVPSDDVRSWMHSQAMNRAQADADSPWSVANVNEYAVALERTPNTARELFDVAVNRLTDLKYDYEDGDTSPAEVVIKTHDETELRNYLARDLQRTSQGRYSISQEDEMPNKQRTDIRFMHANVPGMVPVELKIADNNWSGPDLFDKLRDQLCGDYLRDVNSTNGIYLLVYRGEKQRWQHPQTRRFLGFKAIIDALQAYAHEIITTEAGISNIKVIGIDLAKRAKVQQKR